MHTRFIEAISDGNKSGKFMVGAFTCEEWARGDLLDGGWTLRHLLVLDMTTGEALRVLHGGDAAADVARHQIWTSALFEPFLAWLYTRDLVALLDDLSSLPSFVALPAPLDPLPQAIAALERQSV